MVLRRTDPIEESSWWCSSTATSWAAAVEQVAERTVGSAARRRARTLLHDATRLEHGDLLGPLGGGEPVGDEDAGAAGDQPVGGADDAGLGDRVHPGGGLVEDDDADVAHQQAREGDQLLLAGREAGAAGAEQRVEALGQAGHPVGEAELLDRGLDLLARGVAEEA